MLDTKTTPCVRCGSTTNGFYKNENRCKVCMALKNLKSSRTKKGVVRTIYASQKLNSSRRGHGKPSYTKQELSDWLYSQPSFHAIYDLWKNNGYPKDLKPSVDRLNDEIGYSLSNIQLMTWGENNRKYAKQKVLGIAKKSDNKPVIQLEKDGTFVAEYHSAHEAHRQTGIDFSKICAVCRGDRITTGGYKWRYKKC